MLFCVKATVKESRKFELARLKKKKKGRKKTFWLSGDFLVRYFHDGF